MSFSVKLQLLLCWFLFAPLWWLCFTGTSWSFCIFFCSSMVSSYLVHHGYCSTATAFARVTDTTIQEEQTSIKNRQSKSLGCHSSGVFPLGLYRGVGAVEVTPWEYRAVHSTLLAWGRAWESLLGALFPSPLPALHPLPSLPGELPCSSCPCLLCLASAWAEVIVLQRSLGMWAPHCRLVQQGQVHQPGHRDSGTSI